MQVPLPQLAHRVGRQCGGQKPPPAGAVNAPKRLKKAAVRLFGRCGLGAPKVSRSNKCIATSNKCLTSSNKVRYERNKCILKVSKEVDAGAPEWTTEAYSPSNETSAVLTGRFHHWFHHVSPRTGESNPEPRSIVQPSDSRFTDHPVQSSAPWGESLVVPCVRT